MELWQRFTQTARKAILAAHEEAERVRNELISTEHLLLGLLRQDECGAIDVLESLGVDLEQLAADVRKGIEPGTSEDLAGEVSFTVPVQRALQTSYAEARRLGLDDRTQHIGTKHLLIGLALAEGTAAERLLVDAGATPERIRDAPSPGHEAERTETEQAQAVGSAVGDRQALSSDRIPPAVGPYSQAVRAGDFIFCSGVIGLSPETGKLVEGEFEVEVRQVLDNLRTLLEDCGSDLDNVVKTTVFLADIEQFAGFNGIYAEYFDDAPPARSTIQVAALPLGARLEVEAIAIVS